MAIRSKQLERKQAKLSRKMRVTPIKRHRIEHSPQRINIRLAEHARATSETTSKTSPPANLHLRIGENLDKYYVRLNMPDKFLNMLALL